MKTTFLVYNLNVSLCNFVEQASAEVHYIFMSNKSINQNQQYCIIFQIFKNNNIQIFIMNLGLFSIKIPSDKWSKLGPDNHQSRWPHQILLPVERRDVNTLYHHPVRKDYLIKNCIIINYVARESNPGRKNGNLAWYHYTSGAVFKPRILEKNQTPLKFGMVFTSSAPRGSDLGIAPIRIYVLNKHSPASSVGRAWDS